MTSKKPISKQNDTQTLEMELLEAKQELEDKDAELEEVWEKYYTLQKDSRQDRRTLLDNEGTIADLNRDIRDLEADLQTLSKDKKKLQTENENLRFSVKEKDSQVEECKRQIQCLNDELAKTKTVRNQQRNEPQTIDESAEITQLEITTDRSSEVTSNSEPEVKVESQSEMEIIVLSSDDEEHFDEEHSFPGTSEQNAPEEEPMSEVEQQEWEDSGSEYSEQDSPIYDRRSPMIELSVITHYIFDICKPLPPNPSVGDDYFKVLSYRLEVDQICIRYYLSLKNLFIREIMYYLFKDEQLHTEEHRQIAMKMFMSYDPMQAQKLIEQYDRARLTMTSQNEIAQMEPYIFTYTHTLPPQTNYNNYKPEENPKTQISFTTEENNSEFVPRDFQKLPEIAQMEPYKFINTHNYNNMTTNMTTNINRKQGLTIYFTPAEDSRLIHLMFNVFPLDMLGCWRKIRDEMNKHTNYHRLSTSIRNRFVRHLLPRLCERIHDLHTPRHREIAITLYDRLLKPDERDEHIRLYDSNRPNFQPTLCSVQSEYEYSNSNSYIYYSDEENDKIIEYIFNTYPPLSPNPSFSYPYFRMLSKKLEEDKICVRSMGGIANNFSRRRLYHLFENRKLHTPKHREIAVMAFQRYDPNQTLKLIEQYDSARLPGTTDEQIAQMEVYPSWYKEVSRKIAKLKKPGLVAREEATTRKFSPEEDKRLIDMMFNVIQEIPRTRSSVSYWERVRTELNKHIEHNRQYITYYFRFVNHLLPTLHERRELHTAEHRRMALEWYNLCLDTIDKEKYIRLYDSALLIDLIRIQSTSSE